MTPCPTCQSSVIAPGATVCPYCGGRLDGGGQNGFSIAAILLGLMGGILCWVPWVGLAMSVVGVALAIPAANKQLKLYEWALGISLLSVLPGMILSLATLP